MIVSISSTLFIFQYPLSDRSDWNKICPVGEAESRKLSVSTIGSKWLKLVSHISKPKSQTSFQYPLSDRSDWNNAPVSLYVLTVLLSVSTIGSKWLKLRICDKNSRRLLELSVSTIGSKWLKLIYNVLFSDGVYPFSIHYRIEVIETTPSRTRPKGLPGLSVSTIGSKWLKPVFRFRDNRVE